MSQQSRVEKLEDTLHPQNVKPSFEELYEVLVDSERQDDKELFVKFNRDGLPIGETIGFDSLTTRAKRLAKNGGQVVVVFDLLSCACSPCASPYAENDAGGKVSLVRVDDSTLFRWGTFERGDFLETYKVYHDAGAADRARLVAENSELLAVFANRTRDEWRAILGLAFHAAMNVTDQRALERGDFAGLDDRWLVDVIAARDSESRAKKG